MKAKFNCSTIPEKLLGREEEGNTIRNLAENFEKCDETFSLYIYGVPGTGKTSSVVHNVSNEQDLKLKVAYINCSTLSKSIFDAIFKEMNISAKNTSANTYELLVKSLTNKKRAKSILILDEIDSIKNKDDLNLVFEIPKFSFSKVSIIGIANDLKLSKQITNDTLKVINFVPYNYAAIVRIIQDKLEESNYFEPEAIELCARKAATMGGDLRKALSIIQASIDSYASSQIALEQDKENIDPEKYQVMRNSRIGRDIILKVIQSSQSPFAKENSKSALNEFTLPFQQQVAMCCIVSFFQENACKAITIGEVFYKIFLMSKTLEK